jgi:hypothetical protein
MSRQIYRDFDEFADSIRRVGRSLHSHRTFCRGLVDRGGERGSHRMQQLQIGGASTFAGDGKPGTLTFGVPMTDPHSIRIDGQGLDDARSSC